MLKKSIYFFVINLILSLSYLNTQAQKSKWEWVKSASYNIIPTATTTDGNGNIIAAGGYRSTKVKFDTFHVSSYGQENIFIVKYNANGKVKWAKTNEYGGSDRDNKVLAVATDDSGNVYVTGYFGSAWLKLDTFIRKKNSPTATWADVFIAKYDSNGNALWVKTAGGFSDDYGTAITTDGLGNVYLAGYTENASITFGKTATLNHKASRAYFLVKYNGGGQALWSKISAGNDKDDPSSIKCDKGGNVLVTGIFRSDTIAFDSHKLTNSDIGKAYPDIFLVKYNGNGKVLWAKCGNGAKNGDYTTGVAIDNSGNSFITGNFNSFTIKFDTATLKRMGSYPDIFITKYDSNGALVWAKNKGQVSMEAYANCISSDAAGNIFIAGAYKGSGIKFDTLGLKGGNWTDQDAYAAGFTNDGNVIWLQGAGGRLGTEGINSISNGLNGNVYVVGYFNATAYFGKDSFISFTSNYDMFLAKINYGNISAVQNAEPFNSKEIATLYPNPTHQTITINTQQIIQKTEVFNLAGVLVSSATLQNEINVEALPKGMYFIKIYTAQGVQAAKFVRE